jgi:hypothetical protein
MDVPAAQEHARRVGADVFLAKPFPDAALLSAVRGPRVVARIAASPLSSAQRLVSTATFANLQAVLTAALDGATSTSFRRASPRREDDTVRASIAMSAPQQRLEVRFGVFASIHSAMELARAMIGTAPSEPAMLREVLGELANQTLGAVKASLQNEGYRFTLSLADITSAPPRERFVAGLVERRDHLFEAGEARLAIAIGCAGASVVDVAPSRLVEGMVLAEDLISPSGMLLASAGTRITRATAERIPKHCGAGQVVRVLAAAAA